MSLFGLAAPAVVNAVGGLIGGAMSNKANSAAAAQANAWNVENYQHRYQWTMDDLKKAGLNPILAATSGGLTGNVNGAAALSSPDMASSLGSIGNTLNNSSAIAIQKKQANAQIANLQADTEVKTATATSQLMNNEFFKDTYANRVKMIDQYVENARKQGKYIDAQTQNALKDLAVKDTVMSLNLAKAGEATANSARSYAEAGFTNRQSDFLAKNGRLPNRGDTMFGTGNNYLDKLYNFITSGGKTDYDYGYHGGD